MRCCANQQPFSILKYQLNANGSLHIICLSAAKDPEANPPASIFEQRIVLSDRNGLYFPSREELILPMKGRIFHINAISLDQCFHPDGEEVESDQCNDDSTKQCVSQILLPCNQQKEKDQYGDGYTNGKDVAKPGLFEPLHFPVNCFAIHFDCWLFKVNLNWKKVWFK
jgi:hypothetical protein